MKEFVLKEQCGWDLLDNGFGCELIFSKELANSLLISKVYSFKTNDSFDKLTDLLSHKLLQQYDAVLKQEKFLIKQGMGWNSQTYRINTQPVQFYNITFTMYEGCCIVVSFIVEDHNNFLEMQAELDSFLQMIELNNVIDQSSILPLDSKFLQVIPIGELEFSGNSGSCVLYVGDTSYMSVLVSDSDLTMNCAITQLLDEFLTFDCHVELIESDKDYAMFRILADDYVTGFVNYYKTVLEDRYIYTFVYTQTQSSKGSNMQDFVRFEVI